MAVIPNNAYFPPEILSCILLSFIPGGTLTIPSRELDALRCITHSCSYWRAVALQCPYLWTDLDIRLRSWSDWRTIHAARTCLQHTSTRKADTPLSIKLHVKKYLNYWTSPVGINAPIFLTPHAHRVHRLFISSPMSLTPLIFPRLIDLTVLAHGWETHPDMAIHQLLRRSECAITRISLGRIPELYWGPLLKAAPALEELVTEGAIPEQVIQGVAKGRLGVGLRRMKCAVVYYEFDIFLDMLEARAIGSMSPNEPVSRNILLPPHMEDGGGKAANPHPLTTVTVQCLNFGMSEKQWERIHVLARWTRVDISEGLGGQVLPLSTSI